MGAAYVRKYATATTLGGIMLRTAGSAAILANPTLAAGDCKVSIDGAAFANLATLPSAVPAAGKNLEVVLSSGETTGKRITIVFSDAAGAEWDDFEIVIETFGHASAQYPPDYSDTVRQGMTALPSAAAEAAGGLFTRGTGAGQINQDGNGRVDVNLKSILGTVLTETAGLIAAGFKKFFNVATPTGTVNSLPDVVPGAAGGLVKIGVGALDVQPVFGKVLGIPAPPPKSKAVNLETGAVYSGATALIDARTAAGAYEKISVGDGTFAIAASIWKTNVPWHFENSIVTASSRVFDDSAVGASTPGRVTGRGSFISTTNEVVYIENAGTIAHIQAYRMEAQAASQSAISLNAAGEAWINLERDAKSVSYDSVVNGGTLHLWCDSMPHHVDESSLEGAGTSHIHCRSFDVLDQTGGTVDITADEFTGNIAADSTNGKTILRNGRLTSTANLAAMSGTVYLYDVDARSESPSGTITSAAIAVGNTVWNSSTITGVTDYSTNRISKALPNVAFNATGGVPVIGTGANNFKSDGSANVTFANISIATAGTVTDKAGYSLSGTQTFNNTGTWTGNLSGSVGSVTGAVGSVTGNVGGNVVGSVGSLSGVTFPTNFSTLLINASGHVSRVALVDAMTGYVAPLDASGVRAAIGMGSANLDTQLSGINAKTTNLPSDPADQSQIEEYFNSALLAISTVNDQAAAIKAKTDNLSADPADASDVASAFSTVNGTLTTIATYIDTEVAAIKAKTDTIPANPAAVSNIPTAAQINDLLEAEHGAGDWDAAAAGGDATEASVQKILKSVRAQQR